MLSVRVSVVVVISVIWVFKVYTCSIDVTIFNHRVYFVLTCSSRVGPCATDRLPVGPGLVSTSPLCMSKALVRPRVFLEPTSRSICSSFLTGMMLLGLSFVSH